MAAFIRRLLIGMMVSTLLVYAGSAAAQSVDFPRVASKVTPFGYILDKARWTRRYPTPLVLAVCWEDPTPEFTDQMRWVQDAVTRSWQANAAVTFRGWDSNCSAGTANIHIRVSDEGPHTQGLGFQIDHVQDGMVLNFTFDAWSPACKAVDMYRRCVTSIAVHEFGHALGFAHEQNRPDTPGECMEKPQGGNGDIILTPWDPDSVMNYCNPVYNNNGVLSARDIDSVQQAYGRRH